MLHFEKTGNGKETLVLLHGFMENNTIWNDLETSLSNQFSIVKIDLPGHGKSNILAEVHTMEMMAEEVNKVLENGNLNTIHLLGHSMGGYVSLAFADEKSWTEYIYRIQEFGKQMVLFENNENQL